MTNLLDFNPLEFLNIADLPEDNREKVSKILLEKISQYLIMRTAELLPEEEIKDIDDLQKLYEIAENKIPEFNDKVKIFLEDFKKEFQNNLNLL